MSMMTKWRGGEGECRSGEETQASRWDVFSWLGSPLWCHPLQLMDRWQRGGPLLSTAAVSVSRQRHMSVIFLSKTDHHQTCSCVFITSWQFLSTFEVLRGNRYREKWGRCSKLPQAFCKAALTIHVLREAGSKSLLHWQYLNNKTNSLFYC